MGDRNFHYLYLIGCYRLRVHWGSRWLEKFGAIFHVNNERPKWILTILTKFDGGYFSRFYQSLIKGCTNQCTD